MMHIWEHSGEQQRDMAFPLPGELFEPTSACLFWEWLSEKRHCMAVARTAFGIRHFNSCSEMTESYGDVE